MQGHIQYHSPDKMLQNMKCIYWQCDIGAMLQVTGKEAEQNEWALAAFGVTKNGEIWSVIDIQKLNEICKWSEFHIPIIDQTLQQIEGFLYAMGLDLNMG